MNHRYQPGQQVKLCPGFPHRNPADGPYEVVRQLPHSSDGEHQYRIKSESEQYEHVVKESELERV
jgi:D-lyxose ketol-isomerase